MIRGTLGAPDGRVIAYDNKVYAKIMVRNLLVGYDLPMYILAINDERVENVYGLLVDIMQKTGGEYEIIRPAILA